MKKQSDLSRLLSYAGHYKCLTMLSLVLSAVSALMALLPFVYIWRIIKEVLEVAPNYQEAGNISHNGKMAVLFAVLSMFIYLCALLCSHLSAFRVQANIRSKALHHVVNLPIGFMDHVGSGKMRKIIDESSAATETYLAHQLPDMAGAYVTPLGLFVLLLVFDWRLGVLSLVPVLLAFVIMSFMTGKRMKVKMTEYQKSLDNMSNEAVEYVRGIPVVKTFHQSVFSFKRFKAAIDNYEKWVIAYTKDLRGPMVAYTTAINAVFAILIGAAMFFTSQEITNPFLLNLLFYIIITPVITVTLSKIMYSSENTMLVSESLSRIEMVMCMEPLPETETPKSPKDNEITLEHVSFHYPDAGENALKDLSLSIQPGEHVAFVGPSGGGKTTLASIIARFWDVNQGSVKIGGVDVREIAKEKLMNTVSFVFQDTKLLKISVLENVRLSKPGATREEVAEALHAAMCDDIIEKLPQGMDTVVGAKGIYLSGGEWQRIAIARAMLKDAPILILDEATAFADPDNEVKVQEAFSHMSKGKTVLMIAHRLSTVTECNRVFVLKDGRVAEQGNHKELLDRKGLYAHMWEEYGKTATWKVGENNA